MKLEIDPGSWSTSPGEPPIENIWDSKNPKIPFLESQIFSMDVIPDSGDHDSQAGYNSVTVQNRSKKKFRNCPTESVQLKNLGKSREIMKLGVDLGSWSTSPGEPPMENI